MEHMKSIHSYYVIIGLILISAMIFLCYEASIGSLWLDDICQINMVGKEAAPSSFIANIIEGDNNPPLSHFITAIWMRIAPYGNMWAKLPNIVMLVLGSWFLSEAARRLYGSVAGIIALCISISNITTIKLAAFTVRPYGMLYMLSSLFILSKLMLLQDRERNSSFRCMLLLGIVMLLLAYTHYFGCIVIFASFIADVFQIIIKRAPKSIIAPYFFLLGYIPWIIIIINKYAGSDNSFWPPTPTFYNSVLAPLHIAGNSSLVFFLFLAFLLIIILFRKKFEKELFFYVWGYFVFFSTLILTYIYSAYINPHGSIWVERYFISVSPFLVFLSSVSADRAIDLLLKKKWQKIPAVCIALLVIVLPSAVKLNRSPVDVDERYQQAADYIMTANDVHDPHTAIFCSSYVTHQGWDYYLTHNGKRDGKYVFYSKEISTPEDVADIDIVYYFKVHKEPDEIMKSILNEEFHSVHTDTESGVVKYERN